MSTTRHKPCPELLRGHQCVYATGHESGQTAPLHFNAAVGFWHTMDSMQLGEELINALAQNVDREIRPHEWACIALAALDQALAAPMTYSRAPTEQLREMLCKLGFNV